MKKINLPMSAFLLSLQLSFAQHPGILDSTFGVNGFIKTQFVNRQTNIHGIAFQNDGKIVVAGNTWDNQNSDFAVVRYNIDGTLDKTFNGNGKRTTDFNSTNNYATSIALQNDGKIVVAGYSLYRNGSSEISVARYTVDGTLDKTFSTDGKQSSFHSRYSRANTLAIQADGKIVVAGSTDVNFTVIRYNPDGSLDNNFSGDGRQVSISYGDIGSIPSRATTVGILSDGKIVAGGNAPFENSSPFLICYNTDGTIAWNEGVNGTFGDHPYDVKIAIQKNDKIIAASRSDWSDYLSNYYSFINLSRLKADGSADATLGGTGSVAYSQQSPYDGIRTYQGTGTPDDVSDVTVQSDGKIILGGNAIFRFNSNGNADSTFGTNGIQREIIGFINDVARANNKLYAAGYGVFSGDTMGIISRYFLNPNKAPLVKITSPINDAIYPAHANIILSANASDVDGTIGTVDFYNGSTLLFREHAAPYSRAWNNVPAGNYIITAVATDNSGNVTTSAPFHVTFNQRPTVHITGPVDGASYVAPATIELIAYATDEDGIIKTVNFYSDSTLLFSERYLPYSRSWTNVPEGSYTITAVATDNNGIKTRSIPVNVSVIAANRPIVRLSN